MSSDEKKLAVKQLYELLGLNSLPPVPDSDEADAIMEKFLAVAQGKKQAHPQLIGIGGGPGAGKTFLFEQMKKQGLLPDDAVIYDPDLVMESIPQYAEEARVNPAAAFNQWELPARQLANRILMQAVLAGYHIVYMRTFALADSLDFVRAVKQWNYQFHAHIVTCDKKVALARAKARESKTNRHIAPEILLQRHEAVMQLIPEIIRLADSYCIYENNEKPLITAHGVC